MKKTYEYYLTAPYHDLIKKKQGNLINDFIKIPHQSTAGIMKISEFIISFVMLSFYYGLLFVTEYKITLILTIFSGLMYLIFLKIIVAFQRIYK